MEDQRVVQQEKEVKAKAGKAGSPDSSGEGFREAAKGRQPQPEAGEPSAQAAESLSPEEAQLMQEMMELGIFYGRSKSRTNPKMRPFILTNRSGFGVINLKKTVSALKKVEGVIGDTVQKQGLILLVGTSPSVKVAVREAAEELKLPYVTERWLGGTLTNFDTISKRIKHFKKLKEDKSSGELGKYTKKEQLKLQRELFKLEKLFGGIVDLDKIPALVFVADLKDNEIAAKEAREAGVPVVGVLNTDADPDFVDHGIPANDRNRKGMEFIIGKVKAMILEAREKVPAVKEGVDEKSKESGSAETKGNQQKSE